MNKKFTFIMAGLLFFLSFVLSLNMHINKSEEVCSIKTCDIVRNSQYSKLFGFELTLVGIIVSLVMLFLLIFSYYNKKVFAMTRILSFFVLFFAFYFIFLQFFVIKAICDKCLIVDLSSIIASFFIIFQNERKNNFTRSRSNNKTNRQ